MPLPLIAGAAIAAGGAAAAANSQNSAARNAQQFAGADSGRQMLGLLTNLYGGGGDFRRSVQEVLARLDPAAREEFLENNLGVRPQVARNMNGEPASVRHMGLTELFAYLDSIDAYAGAPGSSTGLGGGQGYLPYAQGLAETVSERQRGNLAYFDADSQRLRLLSDQAGQIAAGSEDLAGRWGRETEAAIDEQARAESEAAQQRYRAQLAASGFGGTHGAGTIAGIDESFMRGARGQMAQVRQGALDRQLTARGERASLADVQTAREYQRSGERMNLENLSLGRDIDLRLGPQQTALSLLSGPVMNPNLGDRASQFYPGASPFAEAATQGGGALAAYGAYRLGGQNTPDRGGSRPMFDERAPYGGYSGYYGTP